MAITRSLLVFVFLLHLAPAWSHTPQHVIDALAVSPAYETDQSAFIIVQNYLLRSTNGGATWQQIVNGIDNKFILSSVVFSPDYANDRTIFLASDGDGIYQSISGGDSWERLVPGPDSGRVGLLMFSPFFRNDGTLLAASAERGMYRSTDRGRSWESVLEQPLITSILFHPDNAGQILAGDDHGMLWQSADNGRTWRKQKQIPDAGRITALALENTDTLWIGTAQLGLHRVAEDGAIVSAQKTLSVIPVDCGGKVGRIEQPTNLHITSLDVARDADNVSVLFATSWYDAVFTSRDQGASWERLHRGISCDNQADRDYATPVPHFRDIQPSPAFASDGTLFLAGFDGLFKSTDSGHTWLQLEPLPVSLIRGLDVSPKTGESWSVALTTYGGGAYISEHQGENFRPANLGLDTTRLADISFSPSYASDGTLFSGAHENILISRDRGHSWQLKDIRYLGWRKRVESLLRIRLGVPRKYSLELFLSESERKRYFPMLIEPIPDFPADPTLFIGTRRQGVGHSRNLGDDWVYPWKGRHSFILSLEISPDYARDRTVFAAERGAGIFRSTDGGDSWQPVNEGFRFLQHVGLPVNLNYHVDQVLFGSVKDVSVVMAPDYPDSGTLFASSNEGLFKTTDRGALWKSLTAFADANIEAMGVSPAYAEDQTLFVSVKGKGLFVSNDGGNSFHETARRLIEQNQSIKYLDFSPDYAKDRTMYAASEENLFRSTNNGDTWQQLPRPVRYEDWRGENGGPIKFKGDWSRKKGPTFSASFATTAAQPDSSATLYFYGSGVDWIGSRSPDHGIAEVFIDGELFGRIDQYSPEKQDQVILLSAASLSPGAHHITIRNTDSRNPDATGYAISLDAFDIAP